MRLGVLFPAALLASSLPAFSDQVRLKNGDTLTGDIIKKDGDKLTIKSEFLGEVSMPWSAVVELKSDKPLNVVLPGGQKVTGPVSVAGTELQVMTPSGTSAAPLTEVSAIR